MSGFVHQHCGFNDERNRKNSFFKFKIIKIFAIIFIYQISVRWSSTKYFSLIQKFTI